jgi:hypothetical protein
MYTNQSGYICLHSELKKIKDGLKMHLTICVARATGFVI